MNYSFWKEEVYSKMETKLTDKSTNFYTGFLRLLKDVKEEYNTREEEKLEVCSVLLLFLYL